MEELKSTLIKTWIYCFWTAYILGWHQQSYWLFTFLLPAINQQPQFFLIKILNLSLTWTLPRKISSSFNPHQNFKKVINTFLSSCLNYCNLYKLGWIGINFVVCRFSVKPILPTFQWFLVYFRKYFMTLLLHLLGGLKDVNYLKQTYVHQNCEIVKTAIHWSLIKNKRPFQLLY